MDITRRELIVVPGVFAAASLLPAEPNAPWHQEVRRVGQVNMTERDVVDRNIEEWADYWVQAKVDAVLVSVTGILAFYPTRVPFHKPGKFLGNRDFFGECCAAAKKRGIRVIARMSPDLNWEEALRAHPEWFERDQQGNPRKHTEDPRLLQNSVRWLLRAEAPVSIEGPGVVEAFAWETEPGFAVHILNYTNPNMHRGWIKIRP